MTGQAFGASSAAAFEVRKEKHVWTLTIIEIRREPESHARFVVKLRLFADFSG